MKKIPTLFVRNHESDRLVRDEINPGCEWVVSGEGVATCKWDGTACLVKDGKLYKRFDAKRGRSVPEGFVPAQDEADPITGHWPGWLPVSADSPEDRWHIQAWTDAPILFGCDPPDGTYELVGPKVNGGREKWLRHVLLLHGEHKLTDAPRDFDGLRDYLSTHDIEGIVWHHPDGRMVKIKGKDFGIRRADIVEAGDGA